MTAYAPDPGLESRWTLPRVDCPHPERWTSDDSDSTEHEVTLLVAAFVRALQPDYVIETGSAWGQTTLAIGVALAANGHGFLDSLEPDPERAAYTRNRCAGLSSRYLQVHEVPSLEFEPRAPIVDFLWLDSLLHLRADEARRFRPWMRKGTIIGMHDSGPHHALGPSLDRLLAEGWLSAIQLPTPRGVTFLEKR